MGTQTQGPGQQGRQGEQSRGGEKQRPEHDKDRDRNTIEKRAEDGGAGRERQPGERKDEEVRREQGGADERNESKRP